MNESFFKNMMIIAPILAGFSINSALRLIPEHHNNKQKFSWLEDLPRLFFFLASIFLISSSISLAFLMSSVDFLKLTDIQSLLLVILEILMMIGFLFFFWEQFSMHIAGKFLSGLLSHC